MSCCPFISYAREDRSFAQRLYRDLRLHGAQPWLDTEDLLGGQEWESAVTAAISRGSHFLALLSANSVNKRGFIQKEVRHALELALTFPPGDVFIVPIRLDDTHPRHARLSMLHWIDFFPRYDEGLPHLLRTLSLGQPQTATLGAQLAGVDLPAGTGSKNSFSLVRDPLGFLTEESIASLVLARAQGRQVISGSVLLFANKHQRTWLVVTRRMAVCVLDDIEKGDLYDPVRWECRRSEALPVQVEQHKKSVGLIHLGSTHRDWLYLVQIHPNPLRLKVEVESLLRG